MEVGAQGRYCRAQEQPTGRAYGIGNGEPVFVAVKDKKGVQLDWRQVVYPFHSNVVQSQ